MLRIHPHHRQPVQFVHVFSMTLDSCFCLFPAHQYYHYYNIPTSSHFLLRSSPPLILTSSLPRNPRRSLLMAHYSGPPHLHKHKLIVIMGATGAGKSRLSIDIAAHFPPSSFEVINSDKIQLYKGLDITTNKITIPDRRGVPHHLLGDIDGGSSELSPVEFRRLASRAVSSISSRNKVPMLVGGSNSLIHALLVDQFDPTVNVFDNKNGEEVTSSSEKLRYDCCFIWVDVSLIILAEYLSKRVDEMLDSGMYEELAEFLAADNADEDEKVPTALRKAIGVPEFSRFFKNFPAAGKNEVIHCIDRVRRGAAYEDAVRAIKENTYQLSKRQIEKILRLKSRGWDLKRLDATEAFRAVVTSSERGWSEIWEEEVVEASVKIVREFLALEE